MEIVTDPEELRRLDGTTAQTVEQEIKKAFAGHPDADILITLALVEVATDDDHRRCLEAAVDDPRSFREYLFGMVGAEVPAPGMHGATPDVPLVCPPTPSRQVLRKRLNESLGPDDSALIREELDDAERARHAGHGAPPDVGSGARADVRKAYLQLAKHYHPDKGGDQDMFLAIHSAYEVLNRTESTASADSALARSR